MYSFDASVEAAHQSYDTVLAAYKRLFTSLRVPYVVAEADAGSIGGSRTHEFHALTPVGEDLLLSCGTCGYTANVEKAKGKLPPQQPVTTTYALISYCETIHYSAANLYVNAAQQRCGRT